MHVAIFEILMTILKDDELNYDCDVWFLKERKNIAQQSQIAIGFVFFIYFFNNANPSQVKSCQIYWLIEQRWRS